MRWVLLAVFVIVSSADAAAGCPRRPIRGAARACVARVAAAAPVVQVRDLCASCRPIVEPAAILLLGFRGRLSCLTGFGGGGCR
jgi:hypothetical protein